jgi:hypothetical protein
MDSTLVESMSLSSYSSANVQFMLQFAGVDDHKNSI